MKDYEEMPSLPLDQPLAPRQRGGKWLLTGGLVFAFMFALGVGAFLGSSTGTSQAAALATEGTGSSQTLAAAQGGSNNSQALTFTGNYNSSPMLANTPAPGTPGQCDALTVSSVNGNTIVAKTSSGSSVTIHTTASTQYTQAGKTVAASAIKAGTRIHVSGTHNSDGSITATRIDIG